MQDKPAHIVQKMEELFPNAQTELENWETDFQFIVCIVLSAQTTDRQVNAVSKTLFKTYPNPKSMMGADIMELERLIFGVNYFRTKAKHLKQLSKMVVEEFGGKIPQTEKELTTLPGVGRKTAHVFLNDFYEANLGIAVDTHVARVAQRMGLTKETNPDKIAADLETIYPQDQWSKINRLFVLYGRYICKARVEPDKSECVLKEYCSHCGAKHEVVI
jgi:endonuclease-3